jgi:hypothetical protein
MRTTKAWDSLQESVGYLWTLLIDNLMAIGAFAIVGFAALVVQKSVEKLQLWGVPSLLIAGMEILHACIPGNGRICRPVVVWQSCHKVL